MTGTLVLVTGTGRSGTSTIAGSLHHLGLYVPGPYLGANESNPKGFFESKWAVKFHKKITAAAGIHEFDSRPSAFERAHAAVTPELREELTTFLAKQAGEASQIVVKDPRSVWVQGVWREAATEAGLDIRYLSMLRHPAEVVGSRTTYYASKADEAQRRRYETFNIARWINNSLISERETRGHVRTFVPYTELLDDWRTVIGRVARELDLSLEGDLSADGHHQVDDFIDPGLRRHQVGWDDLDVPVQLREVAQEIWDQLVVLCRNGAEDPAASARLDELTETYARLFDEADAISHDATEEARTEARRAADRKAADRKAAEAVVPPSPADLPLERRPVAEVGGRDLLRLVARRAAGRVRKR